jgi:hypothetical protein
MDHKDAIAELSEMYTAEKSQQKNKRDREKKVVRDQALTMLSQLNTAFISEKQKQKQPIDQAIRGIDLSRVLIDRFK